MAYNKELAARTEEILARSGKMTEVKAAFGGLCYMVNDKMCMGVVRDELMVRLDPAKDEEVIQMEGCRPMDFTHKTMKGWVFISPEGIDNVKNLEYWIGLALEFNVKAKVSKNKIQKP